MIGVLLMSYGSPGSLEEVEPYYTHIRGGRKPSPELLKELVARYQAIGGKSPLLEITYRQAAALEANLRSSGVEARVYVGMRHSPPFISEAVSSMAKDGIRKAVALSMAPHYSAMSVGEYIRLAEEARRDSPWDLSFHYIRSWHDHPGYIAAVAETVQEALVSFPEREVTVVFTAHSLPQRVLQEGDPYPKELLRTCELVSKECGGLRWTLAYQSAGRTQEAWLGPEVGEVLKELRREGATSVLVCPVGFVADHLEVLYDLDIEARGVAEELGMRFRRAPSLNDRPAFIAALADIVLGALQEG
ncbi:MAG: ferrochelatase [Armatimonadota bacterium]|nr:ferrochelatase [Armatimonadota bacterium]MDR5704334.1 ferrochelatase [Armatimonadota bacterium]